VLVLYGGHGVELAGRDAFAGSVHHPYTRLLRASRPTMTAGWLERAPAPVASGFAAAPDLCPFLPRCPVAVPGLCDRAPPRRHAIPGQQWLCHHDHAALADGAPHTPGAD